jgi:predicted ribosome quality control (RQC) complex YloA/Tae2 family protein
VEAIRQELTELGYLKRRKVTGKPVKTKLKPYEYTTSDGFRVSAGHNNKENDYLTFKLADKKDIWFHTKDIPGSHVILVTDGEEPTDRDYTEAAAIAAGYSQATGDLVAVDYTRVRNIRKPAGSKPGFVTYKTNFTAYVKPIKSIGD